MDIRSLARQANVCEEILEHINSCDMIHAEVYGSLSQKNTQEQDCTACRKLLSMGFYLTPDIMPPLCLTHCMRWRNSKISDGWISDEERF